MSQSIAFNLHITPALATTYFERDSGSVIDIGYNNESVLSWNTVEDNAKLYAFMNSASKNVLFPNAVARPTKFDTTFSGVKSGISTCEANVNIDGTRIITQAFTSSVKSYSFSLTNATITNMTKNSVIEWRGYHTFLTGGSYKDISVTFYFTRYDFSASAGANVSSASVSSSTGYDGDSITYSCVLASGATFDGWYDGATRVSTSQSYTITVAGADRTLEARATMPVTTKTLSATYNGAQLQGFPISVQSDVSLSYNGQSKGSVPFSGGAKTFSCAGKIASGNIGIGSKTLQCAGKLMQTDVIT